MQYFKNTELAKLYPISEKAVRNWIAAAKVKKLDLILHETEKRSYIANTPQNIAKIEKMIDERRKYANKLTHKRITPSSEFYEACTEDQIYEMIHSIEVKREISSQHWNFGKGAQLWEDFLQQQLLEVTPSMPKATLELLLLNEQYFNYLTKPYDKLNIICIGAEVFSTLKNFLLWLENRTGINRLILIDPNREMLKIAKNNVDTWFQGRLVLETAERDMRYERFDDLLRDEELRKDAEKTLNLFLLLGATIYNFEAPNEALQMIHHSLGPRDILVHDVGLDSRTKRGFSIGFGKSEALSPRLRVTIEMLGIKESYYTVEKLYDSEKRQRLIFIRLNVALTLVFKFKGGEKEIHLNKGELLMIFRYWHQSSTEILHNLKKSGFNLLHASHTEDADYLMTISSLGRRL